MHICQTRRTLMMVKPPPPYSFLPQSLVHFLFLCLFSTFSIFNRPWENFSRDQEEKSALIATGSVDWNLGRFPLLNWACQLWPALPQGSWRSSALWQSYYTILAIKAWTYLCIAEPTLPFWPFFVRTYLPTPTLPFHISECRFLHMLSKILEKFQKKLMRLW